MMRLNKGLEMAIIATDTTLDVVKKQKELAKALTDEDSIYIRMKDTLVDLLEKGEIKGTDRARVVSETIAQMAVNLANTSLSTALAWQTQEKELALKKEELKVRLDVLQKEVAKAEEDVRLTKENVRLTEENVRAAKESVRLAQAKRIREYGDATFDPDGNVIRLSNKGLVYEQEQLVKKQIEQGTASVNKLQDDLVTAAKQRLSIDKQIEQGTAAINKLQDDLLTAAKQRLNIEKQTEQGTAAIDKIRDDMLTAAKQRLNIEKQTELYERQKKGFDDNKYQKLFESQINAWGLMFSSGMLTEKPGIITSDKVTQLYTKLTSSL